jgi:hypothetical protein
VIDRDGDGFKVSQGDCNDKDPEINPGVTEVCGDGIDQDCDGQVDEECIDTDNDGILDKVDNCFEISNPDQADSDGDGIGNVCDNCPDLANSNQLDTNSNGIGDICESQILTLTPGVTFDITSDNNIYNEGAEIIILDAFETTQNQVSALKLQNKKVIALISVGTWENWRYDANLFPAELLGNYVDQWNAEKYLDIGNREILLPIIKNRLSMIKNKGFDGIAADNMDTYNKNSGFNITLQKEIDYCRLILSEAHSLGLSVGQVNAPDLITEFYDEFNWLLVQRVFEYNETQSVSAYIGQSKAVLAIEYNDSFSKTEFLSNVCPGALTKSITAILKDVEHLTFLSSCQ